MNPQPLIIEASLNGAASKHNNPQVPYTDEEIVADAVACMDAGAALIHNHTDEPIFGGSGKLDYERYAKPWRRLLELRPDAILTPTMPVGQEGVPVEDRYSHVSKMAQEGLLAQGLCDPGTFNLSLLDEDGLFASSRYLYRNDMQDSRYYVETCRELSIGLSISIFEPSFLKFILAYYRAGKLPAGGILKFYFASDELSFGMPPTVASLQAYLGMLGDCDLPWLVSSFGDDCVGCGLAEEAIKRGGHVQVGLEPYGGDRYPSNVELVQEVVALAQHYQRPAATPTEAAAIMRLPTYPAPYGAQIKGPH
ncbi:3-keto-5-aminohexanoate cleavage protein [Candidatus Litorirhabdus singularis]|uniref:3-keto-5-aminohexanoate cleavage protein n=1 Tax=Candidatus Litorirhabdus singularis TaxID=2518993 RepID=UPI002433278A|nr:3-keto-5-aminohexanoate cleavage protein [Candidatus Litorirhabdus singularis]